MASYWCIECTNMVIPMRYGADVTGACQSLVDEAQ